MLLFDSPFTNPYDNLALEEHLFATLPQGESALLLWVNDNTIVVGKNQNAAQEINADYVAAHHIKVARRLSGGGAVYHDLGNLNFTIITSRAQFEAFHFQSFLQPVLETLASFGLNAAFTGRNDITLNGKKICGNAQYAKGEKLLHHGCIMLGTDLSQVGKALNVSPKKLDAKAVKSVASRVTTINAERATPIAMAEFKARLQAYVFADSQMQRYILTPDDRAAIATLSAEKYATIQWIYKNKTIAALHAEQRFAWGLVQASLRLSPAAQDLQSATDTQVSTPNALESILENTQPTTPNTQENTPPLRQIAALHLQGDFFGEAPVEALAEQLIGAPLDERLLTLLQNCNLSRYLQGSTPEEIYHLLLQAAQRSPQ